jgi:hypothetical protein
MKQEERTFVLFCFVTIALLVDMLISSFSDVFFQQFSVRNVFGLDTLFVVISGVIYVGGLFILNDFVKKVSSELRNKKRDIDVMFKAVSLLQCVIFSIILVIILQIIFRNQYSSSLVIFVTITSYVQAITILGILGYRFIAWFRLRQNSITLLFSVGSGMLAVNLAAGVVIHSYYIWSYESPNVTFSIAQAGLLFPEFTSQSVGILGPLYLYAFFIPLNFAYLFA